MLLVFCFGCGTNQEPATNLKKELFEAKAKKVKVENLAVAMMDSAAKNQSLARDEEFQERLRSVIKEAKGLELVIEATEAELLKKY